MNILGLIIIVLAGVVLYVAWKNEWDWKATLSALGLMAAGAWEAFRGMF